MLPGEDPVRRPQLLGVGLGPGGLGQSLHPLLVLDPLGLHGRHHVVLQAIELGHQHDPGILEHGLDQRQDVEPVVGGIRIEHLEVFHHEGRQRLVQREVVLQVDGHPDQAALVVGLVQRLDDLGVEQRPVDGNGPADVPTLRLAGLVVVDHQPPGGGAAVTRPLQHLEQHRVADREAGAQGLGLPVAQPIERLLVPVGVPPLGRLLLDDLLALGRPRCRLLIGPAILDHVRRRLHPHVPVVVEPLAPGSAGDLLELAHRQDACLRRRTCTAG